MLLLGGGWLEGAHIGTMALASWLWLKPHLSTADALSTTWMSN